MKRNYEKEDYNDVLYFLKEMRHRMISGDIIIKRYDISKIQLRGIIHDLRVNGNPIISSSLGYKYSTNKEEIISSMLSLRNRAFSILDGANGLENYLKEGDYNEEI